MNNSYSGGWKDVYRQMGVSTKFEDTTYQTIIYKKQGGNLNGKR